MSLTPWKRSRETTLTSKNPFFSLHDEMNQLFSDFFDDFAPVVSSNRSDVALASQFPKVNLSETDKALHIQAEMPGLSEENIDIRLEDHVLYLKGEHQDEKTEEDQDKKIYRREISRGQFYREIPLPAHLIDHDKVDAVFKNGVLFLTLPKVEEAQKKARKIQVKKA